MLISHREIVEKRIYCENAAEEGRTLNYGPIAQAMDKIFANTSQALFGYSAVFVGFMFTATLGNIFGS